MEDEQEQEGLDLQLQQSLAAEDVEASGQGGSDEGERYFLRHRHQWAPDEAAQRWGTRPAAFVQTSPRNGRRRNCLSFLSSSSFPALIFCVLYARNTLLYKDFFGQIKEYFQGI